MPLEIEIIDNNDCTYNVVFVLELKATYLFDLVIDKVKYGETVRVEITGNKWSRNTPILCPKTNKCVSNIIKSIPNDCSLEKPFKYLVNGSEICTKHQVDCNCPSGYIKFDIMKYYAPEDRSDMCPYFKKQKKAWIKYRNNYSIFYDGI